MYVKDLTEEIAKEITGEITRLILEKNELWSVRYGCSNQINELFYDGIYGWTNSVLVTKPGSKDIPFQIDISESEIRVWYSTWCEDLVHLIDVKHSNPKSYQIVSDAISEKMSVVAVDQTD